MSDRMIIGRSMFVHNTDIAAIFNQMADLLEIKGDNPFRIRAYRNAARTLNTLATSVQTMVEEKRDLKDLPGIGADLAGKIVEIATTGTCALREQLRHEMPPFIHELLTVPGLGPKRLKTLYEQCHIQTLEQLYRAARDGQISHLPGFGRRVEQRILEAVRAQRSKSARFNIAVAAQLAEPLVKHLHAIKAAEQIEVAGSFRRRQETVGDLDILYRSFASPSGNAWTGLRGPVKTDGCVSGSVRPGAAGSKKRMC